MKKEAGTIDCTPNWDNLVRYFHLNSFDRAWWVKSVKADKSGWFAAVARTHPTDKVANKIGRASKNFKPKASYSGVPKEVAA